MKRIFYVVVLLALAAALYVYAYPRLSGSQPAEAQQTATTGGSKGGSRTGGPPIGVVTAVAQKQTIPVTNTAVGYIQAVNTVVLRSRADGTIVQQSVQPGQIVKAGDVLFKLDDSALQATIAKDQAQILKDQANAAQAQATVARDQDLVKKGVVPQSTLDADMATAKAAQATVQVDQAQLKADQVALSYTTITAPIAGRVGTVNSTVGNVVHASDTSTGGMLTITQMSPLRVSFTVPESELDGFRNALKTKQKVPVNVLAPGDTSPRATGTLSFIDSSVDTSSGTVVVMADVDNSADMLWPGQYVSAVTQLGAYTDATTIPVVAVQQSDAGPYVFLVGPNAKVKKQPVTVVATVGDTAVVGNQLKPGDHVVIEGQLRLSNGSTVRETVEQPTKVASGQTNSNGATSSGGVNSGAGSSPATTAPAGNS